MEFLLPHLEGRQTVTNIPIGDTNDDDSTQDSELQFELSPQTIASTPNSTASFTSKRTIKNDNDNHILREMVDVMKTTQDMRQKRGVTEMDENDYFFLSMSKQFKKLPKTDQAEIKFQIHKLTYGSEVKMLHNRQIIVNTPINVSGNKIIQNDNRDSILNTPIYVTANKIIKNDKRERIMNSPIYVTGNKVIQYSELQSKPLIVKPIQHTYTHIRTPEEKYRQVNVISSQNEDSEETGQPSNENDVTQYYNNFGHDQKT
jgi:hypothetical protein